MLFRFLVRGVEWVAYDWFRSAAPALGLEWDRMPQVFNVGYGVIESALQNQIMLCIVIPLLLLKLVATVITLGSGGSGRIFAPSLFMGAMLGSAFGVVVNSVAPFLPAPPGAYALVGIGPSRLTGRK